MPKPTIRHDPLTQVHSRPIFTTSYNYHILLAFQVVFFREVTAYIFCMYSLCFPACVKAALNLNFTILVTHDVLSVSYISSALEQNAFLYSF